MSREVLVVLAVVISDEQPGRPDPRAQILDLRGRELPGVPGSWVSQAAVHPYPRAHVGSSLADADATGPGSTAGHATAVAQAQITAEEEAHELDLDFGLLDPVE